MYTQPTDQRRKRLVLRFIDTCLALQEPLSAAQRRRMTFRLIDTGIHLFMR